MSLCVKCNAEKPDDEFIVQEQSKRQSRLSSWCKTCTKEYNRQYYLKNKDKRRDKSRNNHFVKKYGMTVEEVDHEISLRDNKCDICGEESDHRFKKLNVDHCHETNAVRGFLCFSCNVMIGQSKDDPDRLRKAADYLEMSK